MPKFLKINMKSLILYKVSFSFQLIKQNKEFKIFVTSGNNKLIINSSIISHIFFSNVLLLIFLDSANSQTYIILILQKP